MTLTLTLALLGCDAPKSLVGQECANSGSPVQGGVSFIDSSPSCEGGTCIVTPPSASATATDFHSDHELAACTRTCERSSDCKDAEIGDRCERYVCAVPSALAGPGNHCCEKLCVCAADLIPGFNQDDGSLKLTRDAAGVAIPNACLRPDACK